MIKLQPDVHNAETGESMSSRITVEYAPDAGDAALIARALRVHIAQMLGAAQDHVPFSVFARTDDGTLLGGVNARVAYGDLHIDQFWIDPAHRGQGTGAAILEQAEDAGRRHGCRSALLNTVAEAMVDYYCRRGYALIGEVPMLAGGRAVYFLSKSLAPRAVNGGGSVDRDGS